MVKWIPAFKKKSVFGSCSPSCSHSLSSPPPHTSCNTLYCVVILHPEAFTRYSPLHLDFLASKTVRQINFCSSQMNQSVLFCDGGTKQSYTTLQLYLTEKTSSVSLLRAPTSLIHIAIFLFMTHSLQRDSSMEGVMSHPCIPKACFIIASLHVWPNGKQETAEWMLSTESKPGFA